MGKVKKEKSKLQKILEGIGLGIFIALIAASSFAMISSIITKQQSENKYAPTKIGSIYMPLIVETDSMSPEIKKKSAIFIKKTSCDSLVTSFNNGEKVDLCFDDTFGFNTWVDTMYTTNTSNFLQTYEVDGVARPKTDRTTFHTPAPIRTLTHRVFHVQVNDSVEYGEGKYFFFVEGINMNSTLADPDQYQVCTENEIYGKVVGSSVALGAAFNFIRQPYGLIILLLIPSLYMIISSVIDLFKSTDEEPKTEVANPSSLDDLSEKDIKRLKDELLQEIVGKEEHNNEK